MRIRLPNGELDPRIRQDPRWSQAQRQAAMKAAEADDAATIDGLDARLRPVVSLRLDGPRSGRSTYALLRNGDPAKPVMPLSESWPSSPRRPRAW